MYYEVHDPDKPGFGKSGEPVALLHGAFTTIANNRGAPKGPNWIGEPAKTRRVICRRNAGPRPHGGPDRLIPWRTKQRGRGLRSIGVRMARIGAVAPGLGRTLYSLAPSNPSGS